MEIITETTIEVTLEIVATPFGIFVSIEETTEETIIVNF